jgi:hypothetical protein
MNVQPHAQDRDQYIRLCFAYREQGRAALEDEMHEIARALDRLSASLSQAIAGLQGSPGNWLQRWLKPRMIEERAAAEFDALVRSAYVAQVDVESAKRQLVVTTTPMFTARHDSQTVASPLRLHMALNTGVLSAEPARPLAGQLLLRPVAAALIGAGDLAALIGLIAGLIGPGEHRSGTAQVSSRARGAYIQCRTALLLESQADSREQKEAEGQIAAITRQLGDIARRVCAIERTLVGLRSTEPQAAEDYGREFDLLTQLPGVRAIRADPKAIYIDTEPISLRAEGVEHRIGHFRIEIYPGARVEMHNTDRALAISGGCYDHPHIYSHQPCLGDSQSFFAVQLAHHNYPAIVQQGLEFLRSYNPSSAFASAASWSVGVPLREDSTRQWTDDD